MTIGRTDDPKNPFRTAAFEAASLLGSGSRTPSGPADMAPRREGRTHDRNRPTRQTSHFSSCIQGAVHTWHGGRQTERLWRTGGRRALADADLTEFYATSLSGQFHQDPPLHFILPVQYQQITPTPWVGPPCGLTWYGGERRTQRPFHKAALIPWSHPENAVLGSSGLGNMSA